MTVLQDLSAKPGRERFFYRDLSGGWTERAAEVPLKNILLCSAATADSAGETSEDSFNAKCFCHLHKAFEAAQIKDGKVIFECGAAAAKGLAVPFVEYTEYIAGLNNEVLAISNKIVNSDIDLWRKNEELKKNQEYQGNKKQIDAFNDMYLFPKGKLPSDVFELKISESQEHDKVCLRVTEFARDKFYKKMPFRLNENFARRTYFTFDAGHFKNKLFGLNNIPLLYQKYKLPSNVQEVLSDSVRNSINKMAGKELQFHTTMSGLELLNAASFFPYEPNVYQLLKYFFCDEYKEMLQTISPRDTDLAKKICNFYGVKPYRTLRKLFVEEPAVLYFYVKFYELGFRDKNFFNERFKEIKSFELSKKFSEVEKQDYSIIDDVTMRLDNSDIAHGLSNERHFFSEDITSGLNLFYGSFLSASYSMYYSDTIDNLKFFCDVSLPLRGEKATYLSLAKDKTIDRRMAIDTLRMFRRAYSFLSEKEKHKILNEGLTTYNHDLLAKITNQTERKNVDFKLEDWQVKLEGNVRGYSFALPKDYYALRDLGSKMSNCVASYKYQVLAQKSTIVSAAKDGVFCACIEIIGKNRVVQKVGNYNKQLQGEVADAVAKWMKKHKLVAKYG